MGKDRNRVATGALIIGLAATTLFVGAAPTQAASSSKNPVWLARAGASNVAFVLWRTSCGSRACFQLQRTIDGGHTFSTVSAPPIAPGRSSSGDLFQLVFANPSDGYAVTRSGVGVTGLYATFNGGRSWQHDAIRAWQSIEWVTSTPDAFYAVAGACRDPHRSCGGWALYRTPASNSEWSGRSIPFSVRDMVPPAVAASGSNVWLTGQQQTAPYRTLFAVSRNDDQTFTVTQPRVLSSVNGCGLEAGSPSVLWALCDQGNMRGDIPLSRDGGVRWTQSQRNFTGSFAWGVFDVVSKGIAYFVDPMYGNKLFRVAADTLRTRAVGRAPNFDLSTLVFLNPLIGLALSQPMGASGEQILYRTRDAGAAWQRVFR